MPSRECEGPAAGRATVLGPLALYPPGSREEWADLERRIAPHQHPLGPAGFNNVQQEAATELEAHLTPYSLYFGLREQHALHREEDVPPRLRLAHGDEFGTPFDEFVSSSSAIQPPHGTSWHTSKNGTA